MTAETIEWPDVCPNCGQETEVAIVSKSKKSPTMFSVGNARLNSSGPWQ